MAPTGHGRIVGDQQQVARRQVTMDGLGRVQHLHGRGDGVAHPVQVTGVGSTTIAPGGIDPRPHVSPVGQLQNEEGLGPVVLADVVDGHHMRAGHAAQQLTFQHEPFAQIGVEGMVLGQHLHGHIAVEAGIPRPVHGGERTGAEHGPNLVPADAVGRRRAHRTDPPPGG